MFSTTLAVHLVLICYNYCKYKDSYRYLNPLMRKKLFSLIYHYKYFSLANVLDKANWSSMAVITLKFPMTLPGIKIL